MRHQYIGVVGLLRSTARINIALVNLNEEKRVYTHKWISSEVKAVSGISLVGPDSIQIVTRSSGGERKNSLIGWVFPILLVHPKPSRIIGSTMCRSMKEDCQATFGMGKDLDRWIDH